MTEADKNMDGKEIIGKEPWIAVILSTFIWGIGQLYAGCLRKGCILIVAVLVTSSVCFILFFGPTDNILFIISFFLLTFVIGIWNIFDAYYSVKKKNAKDFELIRKSSKDPWLAVFLSSIIAGLGHLYMKKYFWGITYVCLLFVITYFKLKHIHIYHITSAFFVAIACFHAYVSSPVKREKTKKLITVITSVILLWGLLQYSAVMIFTKYFIKAYKMNLISMSPAVLENDSILVKKSCYNLVLGDVIVFKSTHDKNIHYMSRLIAFGGENVEIIDGSVFIDGKKTDCQFRPELRYSSHGKYGTDGNSYKVPEGSYYVLGDNSKNSYDSRAFGAIPEEDVIGKAYKICWPLNRFGLIE